MAPATAAGEGVPPGDLITAEPAPLLGVAGLAVVPGAAMRDMSVAICEGMAKFLYPMRGERMVSEGDRVRRGSR
jgi:hypothetical protein